MHLHWERGGVDTAQFAFKKARTCFRYSAFQHPILNFSDKDEHEKIVVTEGFDSNDTLISPLKSLKHYQKSSTFNFIRYLT